MQSRVRCSQSPNQIRFKERGFASLQVLEGALNADSCAMMPIAQSNYF
jgi:hypothetical protein